MKNKFKALLSLLAVCSVLGAATACGGMLGGENNSENSSVVETPAESGEQGNSEQGGNVEETTYTVTFMADGVEVAEQSFTASNKEITVPEVPAKTGYTGEWETYELGEGNVVVNAVYTATEYKVIFMDGETVVAEKVFTVETEAIEVPAVPEKAGYENGVWGAYDLEKLENQTVTATYTAIEYTITFMNGETEVGKKAFTVETEEIEEPAIPAKEHYTGAWGEYDLTKAENQTVSLVYTATEYKVNFVNEEGMVILPPVKFTIENINEVVFPEVPADFIQEGYEAVWEISPAELELKDCEVGVILKAKTYTITLNANGGDCATTEVQVTYMQDYTLPVATAPKAYQELEGWADEQGNVLATEGTWQIAGNVTLKAVYSTGLTFNSGVVPTAFAAADEAEALHVIEKDGNKVLQIQNRKNSPAMKVTVEFLAAFFADENVDYVAFDAIADAQNNNFRRDTGSSLSATTYEHDMVHEVSGFGYSAPTTGVRADSWKTFYFSRADYNYWVSKGVTSARFIASGGFQANQHIYIDNIRPATEEERQAGIASFESGGVRVNDNAKTLLFYTVDQGGTWQFHFQVSDKFTAVSYTNEIVSEGIRAVQFTKTAGNLNLNVPSGKAFSSAILDKTGYYAVDIYVPADSDATMNYHVTNYPGASLKKGDWTTIYVSGKNQITISDTTGGTYCVDNFRSISEAQYNAATLSFEANGGGLRTKEANDLTAHSSVAYYYAGPDHSANRYSFAIAEGNGASDVATLSNVRLDSTMTHGDSDYSLAFDKGSGYMYITMRDDSNATVLLKEGFTFWIYSTVDIDGANSNQIINGNNNKFNGGEGIYVKANEWTKITVTKEDGAGARFLIMQGKFAGTIYIDDIQPL